MTRDFKKQYNWDKENSVFIGVKLMKKRDHDIIEYIDKKQAEGETKQGIIKRSLRNTMDAEGFTPSDPGEAEEEDTHQSMESMAAEPEPEYSPDPGEKE